MVSGAVASSQGPESGIGKGAHVFGSVASMAGMGAMIPGAGLYGAAGGAIVGLAMGIATLPEPVDEATEALKKQIDVQGMLQTAAAKSAQAIEKLTGNVTPAGFVQTKEDLLNRYAANESLTGTKAFDKLLAAQTPEQAIRAMKQLDNMVRTQTIAAGAVKAEEIRKEEAGGDYGRSYTDIQRMRMANIAAKKRNPNINYKMFDPIGIGGLDTGESIEEQKMFRLLHQVGSGMGMRNLRGGAEGAVQVRSALLNRGLEGGTLNRLDIDSFRGMAPEEILAQMTGLDANFIRPAVEAHGSEEGVQHFLASFLGDLEAYLEAQKKLTDATGSAATAAEIAAEIYGTLLSQVDAVIVQFEGLKSASKLNHDSMLQEIAARRKTFQLDQQIDASKVAMLKTEREIIEQRQKDAKKQIENNEKEDKETARIKRQFGVESVASDAGLNAAAELAKLIKEGKIAAGGAKAAGVALGAQSRTGFTLASLADDPEGLRRFVGAGTKRLQSLRVKSATSMGALSADEGAELAMLEATIPKLRTLTMEEFRAKKLATQKAEEESGLAEKRFQLELQNYKNSYEINKRERQRVRERTYILDKLKETEARQRARRGQLGSQGVADAYSATIESQIAAEGIGKVNVGGVMSQTFRNEMSYNQVDTFRDFRDGVKDVAGTMKSSFAEAFQAMSSGASSFEGAMASMAQSILNSISSMSANMFSNMLFSSFGSQNAHGGYIPGYNAGGLVTGGSGHKDDVLTRMSGGEFVIKKSAVNKIGLPALNAINGYAEGGQVPGMWKMGAVAAGASALSGVIGSASQSKPPGPAPSQDYGMGRSQHGFLGGPDPDAGQVDRISGGRGAASVSLGKGFVYYRRDPATGRLVSERARPTEGRFEVSQNLSLLGRLNELDPQTARMFQKEETMAKYQDYLATETQSRKDQIRAIKKQKNQRLIGAYMNAAMLIGGAKFFGGGGTQAPELAAQTGGIGSSDPSMWGFAPGYDIGSMETTAAAAGVGASVSGGGIRSTSSWTGQGYSPYAPGNANCGLARVMGGEYIMSPQAVRTHGVGFMSELNRGNVPAYASGGLVGGGPTLNTGGNMTNNVKINVNIDKSGKASAQAQATTSEGGPSEERGDQQETQDNSKFGEMLQNVVIEEIVKQQRPGGLLERSASSTSL